MKKIIFFIIIFASVLAFVGCGGVHHSITTEKDDSYDKKVERIYVILIVEEQLRRSVFYGYSMPIAFTIQRAFNANGLEAFIRETSPESESLKDYEKEAELFAYDAIMRIDINPFFSTRDDRNQEIVGHDYEASVIDMETKKKVWHATGKVNYSKEVKWSEKVNYSNREKTAEKDLHLLTDMAKMVTAGGIVSAFITEVNGQEFVFWLPK